MSEYNISLDVFLRSIFFLWVTNGYEQQQLQTKQCDGLWFGGVTQHYNFVGEHVQTQASFVVIKSPPLRECFIINFLALLQFWV